MKGYKQERIISGDQTLQGHFIGQSYWRGQENHNSKIKQQALSAGISASVLGIQSLVDSKCKGSFHGLAMNTISNKYLKYPFYRFMN